MPKCTNLTQQPVTIDLLRTLDPHEFARELIAFHRGTFGDVRMEDDAAAKAAADAAAKAAADAASKAAADAEAAKRGPGTDGDKPISEMTDAEKATYFEAKATRYKNTLRDRNDYDAIKAERDQLRTATLSDAERAIEAARAEEREKVTREVATSYQTRLVQSEVKAALAGRMPAEKVEGLVQFLDPTKFLTENGEVDPQRVQQYAESNAPGKSWPDLGGGSRGSHGTSKGVDAGRELHASRKQKSTSDSKQ